MSENNIDHHKIIFIDTEFTGEHQYATLVSIGIVTLSGESLYLTLNDYDKSQVTDWLEENVLSGIDPDKSVDSASAAVEVGAFLDKYSGDDRLYVVSAGLNLDIVLFFELFNHLKKVHGAQFHALHDLPGYLQHHCTIDLNTLFRVAGVSPSTSRALFANVADENRHNALSDAAVVRECFIALTKQPAFDPFVKSLLGE